MSTEQPKGPTDIFGLAPYGDAIKIAAQGLVDGTGAFLSRICLPAAEELGQHFRDKVSAWRRQNAASILVEAERLVDQHADAADAHAHPRIVSEVLEKGSWSDETLVQRMWAGLLASACTSDSQDDSNLMFVDLLGRLSAGQAALIDNVASRCVVMLSPGGWLQAGEMMVPIEDVIRITGKSNLHTLDREIDFLVAIGLCTHSGLDPESMARIRLTTTGLQLYASSKGFQGDPAEFFKARIEAWDINKLGEHVIDGGGALL